MKRYNVTCPLCGTVNRDLYLEETEGWMECENCGQLVNALTITPGSNDIPIYSEDQLGWMLGKKTTGIASMRSVSV